MVLPVFQNLDFNFRGKF